MKIRFHLLLFLFFLAFQLNAQKQFTDYKPKYTEWNSRYILDKVEYTKDNTIFHFRYLARKKGVSSPNFYGVGHVEAWALQNVENGSETFKMIALKNIRRNGRVITSDFKGTSKSFSLKKKEVLTCEVYFPRLPKHIKKAHFLEGIASAKNSFHFHCLNVKIKHKDDDLGTERDMKNRIVRFEKRVWGEPKEKEEIIEIVEIKKTKIIEESQAEISD